MRQNTTDDREDVTSQARNEDEGVEENGSSENWEKVFWGKWLGKESEERFASAHYTIKYRIRS